MRAQPAFASRYFRACGNGLRAFRLEALKPHVIVPSHGPIGDGTAFITGYRAYLIEVRDRTAAEKQADRSVDEAVEKVSAAVAEHARDKARLAGAVKAAYAEAERGVLVTVGS